MPQPYVINDPWCRHIPQLHRILAGAAPPEEFPAPARADRLEDACAVWESLHYLLRFLLGWEDPGQGLAWWYAAGKPVEDSPLLRTVSQLWDQNGELDFYAAWTWDGQKYPIEVLVNDSVEHVAKRPPPNDTWLKNFLLRPQPRWFNPYYGGGNALHLGHSEWFGNDQLENDTAQLYHDLKTRRAVLIVNNIGTWRRDLRTTEARLPDLGDRSWHVQVFDKQHGSLGTFRRSRMTGKWFQGKHGVHVCGNGAPTEPST